MCVMFCSIAEKYKLMQRADMTDPYPFSRRAFAGWDYAVTYANTARRKATHIATEFKVYLTLYHNCFYDDHLLCSGTGCRFF